MPETCTFKKRYLILKVPPSPLPILPSPRKKETFRHSSITCTSAIPPAGNRTAAHDASVYFHSFDI